MSPFLSSLVSILMLQRLYYDSTKAMGLLILCVEVKNQLKKAQSQLKINLIWPNFRWEVDWHYRKQFYTKWTKQFMFESFWCKLKLKPSRIGMPSYLKKLKDGVFSNQMSHFARQDISPLSMEFLKNNCCYAFNREFMPKIKKFPSLFCFFVVGCWPCIWKSDHGSDQFFRFFFSRSLQFNACKLHF